MQEEAIENSKDRTAGLSDDSRIELRPVAPEDQDFLIELYASTRAEEMSLVPRTEEQKRAFIGAQFMAQREHYQKVYPGAAHDLVLSNSRKIGRLYVARLDTEIHIVDLVLLPAERNQGIGSYVIKSLCEEARQSSQPLTVYVESFNPYLNFFERLGFTHDQTQGVHILMRWSH